MVGKGIGEGLAAGYLWVSGQRPENQEPPDYYQEFAANAEKLRRARAHLEQLTAAQPGSPAAASAGRMLKQITDLQAMNRDYYQRNISPFWISTQVSAIAAAALLH